MESNSKNNKKDIKNNSIKKDYKNNLKKLIKDDFSNYKNLIEYYDNKNNLDNEIFLRKIIEELIILVKKDYGTILLPFLSPPCHELLECYINSNLDEEESIKSIKDFKYIKIFEVLKNNIFISKENISLIYSYFGSLFLDAKEIKENDIRLKKFLKIKELWKIFYTLPNNKINNNSNFTFIGGKLIFEFKEPINLNKRAIFIKINFSNNKYLKNDLDNINFLKLNNTIIDIKQDLKNNNKDINKLLWIQFKIYRRYVDFDYQFFDEKQSNIKKIAYESFENLNSLTILDKYYGQIHSIEVNQKNLSLNEKIDFFLYYPIPTTEENTLGYIKNTIKYEETNYINDVIDLTTNVEKNKFKISNDKLIKINYINYYEEKFNVIEYFGGITQLLPFMSLIKNLFENENIKLINSQSKKDVLKSFVTDILCSFINIIFHYTEYKIKIEKYKLFFFCILTELDSVLLSEREKIINAASYFGNSNFNKTIQKFIDIINIETNENKNEYILKMIKEEESLFDNYEYFFNQFYTKLMKELFIYNQNWSRKDLFFNKNEEDTNKISIKYKQLNYYTKSFQQPFIYPILEIDKYYPKFNEFSIDNLYKNPDEKILNYDFSLSENNIILKGIKNYISQFKEKIEFEKCCLVKKIYHVKGKLGVRKKKKKNIESFEIIFISNDKDEEYTCNKLQNNEKESGFLKLREKTKNVCHGSISKCLKKEYNRKIIIKSEDILFLLFREYFHRVSGIEIFTKNNKSYYFNFNKKFDIKQKGKRKISFFIKKHKGLNLENNNIKDEDINEDEDFNENSIKEIKNIIISNITNEFKPIYKNKTFLGFYNKTNKNIFFPLFEHKFAKTIKYLSNYDILIYINLLANRSFKDLYQYPIFPMFYNIINKNRNIKQHIGFQDFNESLRSRMDLIIESYISAINESKFNKESSSENHFLFHTHYSNPIYTSNFLIRIFPYSFSCIELQGDGFDNPNRLFYSIESSMLNNISQKSDLRELIPELYYFYDLFINKNNLKLNKLANNKEIDTVSIFTDKENETPKDIYKFIADMRNILEKEKNLNEWIDLIFGAKSEKDEKKRYYYSKTSLVTFENNEELLKDRIVMDSTDFGLVPFKIFNSKIPTLKKDNFDKLKIYNSQMTDYEHFINYSNPMKCCMCIGRIYIDDDYLNKYKNKELIENINLLNKMRKLDEFIYYFIGDIFGNITIYKFVKENIYTKYVYNFYSKTVNKVSQIKNKLPYHPLNLNFYHRKEEKNVQDAHNNIGINDYEEKNININNENWTEIYNNINIENNCEINDLIKEDNILNDENTLINNDWIELNHDSSTLDLQYYNAKIDRINIYDFSTVTIYKKIYAHQKQIRFIDFNRRLNIFVTYALDDFINLYLFPSCKLINSIKVSNILKNKVVIFDKVLLASTPFPMIICLNKSKIYILDINGNYINEDSFSSCNNVQIHIDKNCGIVQDFITKDGKEYSLPFIN